MKTIFIHALWRTGSTYLWKKFHDQSSYRSYYEALHESLWRDKKPGGVLSSDVAARKALELHHPITNTSYFQAFPLRPSGGVPLFEKGFSYERYCLETTDSHDNLQRYIESLVAFAHENQQIPVFKFNRSLLRSEWLAARVPSINLLVVRHPFDVWKSFCAQGNYYLVALCLVIGQNRAHRFLKPIADMYEVPYYVRDTVEEELGFYSLFVARHRERLYGLFYMFHLLTLAYNLRIADCVIDITAVSSKEIQHEWTEERLRECGISLSLADCKAVSYANDLEGRVFDEEHRCLAVIADTISREALLTEEVVDRHSRWLGRYSLDVFKNIIRDSDSSAKAK